MIEKWIIPCNVKHFDLVTHFKKSTTAVWKNSFTIQAGDIVYIYLSAPYSEIKYKCRVISDKVTDDLLRENSYAIPTKESHNYFSKKTKYIQIQKECEYPAGLFPLSELKEHGLGQVQIQARTDRQVQAYLDSKEDALKKEVQ